MVYSNFYRLPTIPCSERDNLPGTNTEITNKTKREQMCLGLNPNQVLQSIFPSKANPVFAFKENRDKQYSNLNQGLIGDKIVRNSSIKDCAKLCLDDYNCKSFQMDYPSSKCEMFDNTDLKPSIPLPSGMTKEEYSRNSYYKKQNSKNVVLGKPINYYEKSSGNSLAGTPIDSQSGFTLDQCAGLCNGTQNCQAFNYFEPKNSCRLFDNSQSKSLNDNNGSPGSTQTDVFTRKTDVKPLIQVPITMEAYYANYPTKGMIGDNICKFEPEEGQYGSCVLEKVIGDTNQPTQRRSSSANNKLIQNIANKLPSMATRSRCSSTGSSQSNGEIKINGRKFNQCQTNAKNGLCITGLNYNNNIGGVSGNPDSPNPPYQTSLANQDFDIYLNRGIPTTVLPYSTASKMKNNDPGFIQMKNGLVSNVADLPCGNDDPDYYQSVENVSSLECQKYCNKDNKCTGFAETYDPNGNRECKFYNLTGENWNLYAYNMGADGRTIPEPYPNNLMSNLYVKKNYSYLVNGKPNPPSFIESFVDANRVNRCRNCCKMNPNDCCLDCQRKNDKGRSSCPKYALNKEGCKTSAFGCCEYHPLELKENPEGTNCTSAGISNRCENKPCKKYPYSCCQDCKPINNRSCPITVTEAREQDNSSFDCNKSMYGCCQPPYENLLKLDSLGLNCPNNCKPINGLCSKDLTNKECCVNCKKISDVGSCSANYPVKSGNGITCEDSKWGCCYGTDVLKNDRLGSNCPKNIKEIEQVRGETGWSCGDEFDVSKKKAICCLGNNIQDIYQDESGSNCILTPNFAGDPLFKRSMIETFVVNNPVIPQTVDDGLVNSSLMAYSGKPSTQTSGEQPALSNLFGHCPPPNQSIIKNNAVGTNCPNFSNELGNILSNFDDNKICKFNVGQKKLNELVSEFVPSSGDAVNKIKAIVTGIKKYIADKDIKNVVDNKIKINLLSSVNQKIKEFIINIDENDVIFKSYIFYQLGMMETFVKNLSLSNSNQSIIDIGRQLKSSYGPNGILGTENEWIDFAYNMISINTAIIPFSTIKELFNKMKNFPFYEELNSKCLFKKLVLKPLALKLYQKFKNQEITRDVFQKTMNELLKASLNTVLTNAKLPNLTELVSKIIKVFENENKLDNKKFINEVLNQEYQLCTIVIKTSNYTNNLQDCSGPYIPMSELAIYSIKENGGNTNKSNIDIFKKLVYDNYYLYLEDLYLKTDILENISLDYNGLLTANNITELKNVNNKYPFYSVDETNRKINFNKDFILKLNLDFLLIFSTTGVLKYIKNNNKTNSDRSLQDKVNDLTTFLGDGVLPFDTFHNFELFNLLNSLILGKLILENGLSSNETLTHIFKNKCQTIILFKQKNCLENYFIDKDNNTKYESGCCWDQYTDRGLNSQNCSNIKSCFKTLFGCCSNGLALPNPVFLAKTDINGTKCTSTLGLDKL